jgi:hypothetical protein
MSTPSTIDATRAGARPALLVVPVTFDVACGFVEMWHRHEQPPVGHKFSIGVATADGVLRGVAIVGRPVARHFDNGQTLEVTRTATDGTANANSALHAAAYRATKALGWTRLITYTQSGQSRSSLRGADVHTAAGTVYAGTTPNRPTKDQYPPTSAALTSITPERTLP